MAVSFYGNSGETTGSVSNRRNIVGKPLPEPPNAIHETTGSCGYLREQAPRIETLDKDTVCFKGNMDKQEKSSSFFGTFLTLGALAAVVVGGLGLAHKYNAVEYIKNDKLRDLLKNSGKVTEPCYNWCKSVKTFCTEYYDKIAKRFKK